MAKVELRDGTVLGDYERPYVVAELNMSHSGSVETAKEMVNAAEAAGCDCVKFQSWSADSLYSKTFYAQNPIAKRMFKKFSLSEDELLTLAQHAGDRGIAFSSTPYSRAEVDFLIGPCAAPYVKIASMDINNFPFLEHVARTGVPIVLSTGMSDFTEVERAVRTITTAGNHNVAVLHCVSLYPTEPGQMNLRNIESLRSRFPAHPIGFSDHSLGYEVAAAAVALGACLVEKHLTLDRQKIGMDNQMATEPDEMAALVKACHNVHEAMGAHERILHPKEMEQRPRMRRSVVACQDLEAGHVLALDDLDLKRPGTGIPPEKMPDLVGRRLRRPVEANSLLSAEDLA